MTRAGILILLAIASGCSAGLTDVERGIRKLPRREREAARTQQVCPVTGDALGKFRQMPIKVEVNREALFVCCSGCALDLQQNLPYFKLGLIEPLSPPGDPAEPQHAGLEVTGFVDRSPAQAAGVRVGDCITAINDNTMASWKDANDILHGMQSPTTNAVLRIARDDMEVEVLVALRPLVATTVGNKETQ